MIALTVLITLKEIQNMKACDQCTTPHSTEDRVFISNDFRKAPLWYRLSAVSVIYLPILTWPFVLFSAWITYLHLRMLGAKNIRPLSSFLPDPKSHRYDMKTQIVMKPKSWLNPVRAKTFWLANCSWYCPYSVGLFEWHSYLVKIVENWWCPFHHDRKDVHYKSGAINQSFWHIYPEAVVKLHPKDFENPIWNKNFADNPIQEITAPLDKE
jgi:hypothetical protein